MSAAASGVKPAVPSAPVITIISSDGESFSLSADSVAHSHLLDGALRRWAEVYQAKAAQPSSTRNNKGSGDEHGGDHAERRSGSLPNDDDATNTDITVDDPEETPDERFIERYYDETASDVTATSGALEESAEGLDGVAGGGGAGGGAEAVSQDADRPHVMRMVSVPVNDEDDNDDEGEEKNALAANAALVDAQADLLNPNNESDTDSDRTASVLPSSHEGSLSNSNTPTKLSNHSDTLTAAAAVGSGGGMGAAPRSISPFVSDGAASAPTKAPFSPSSRNGSLSDAAASFSGGPKGGQPLRSPASAVRSPISRGSHQSPSTLLDADQSTPSVLSDEEAEEEGARPARSADPRNLGDEGLEDKEEEGEEGSNDTDNADVAARATAERGSPSPLPEATVSSTARYTDPNAATSAPVEKKPLSSPSSPLRSRLSDRRRSATVVQADAAEDDSDDVISAAAGGRGREDCSDPLTELGATPSGVRASTAAAADQASLPAAAFLLRGSSHTPGSARSGSGGAVNGFAGASPSSCHQRTPCIADEDDVGAMVGEESDDDDEPVPTPAQATGGAGGGDAAAESYSWSNGARATAGGSSGSARGAAVATTTATTTTTAAAAALPSAQLEEEEEEEGAVALADLDSSLVYCDAIRITSGAIVVDLAHAGSPHTAPTTPSQSPQSLREAPASPAAAAHELISPASPASGADGAVTATPSACLAPLPSPAATATTDGGKQGSEASTAVSGAKVNIHSSILTLCIRYMTHFAESEAEAARHRDGRRKRHHRRHRRRGSTGSATPATSSDVDDDEEEERDSSSKTSSGSGSGSSTDSSTNTSDSDTDSDDDDDASTVSHSSISPPPLLSAGSSGGGGNNAGGGSLRGGAVAGSGEAGALPGNAPPPGGPALLPLPLSAPLIKYLSPWERTFLYTDVLGCSASVLTAALAIEEVCPEFDYVCPGPWLSKPRVRAALMTPPPPPEGVHTLMEVLAAAKQLQLDPLHALCAGWLADFVIRVSYGATDNFEAAHLIRQCLRVPSDWSRRETDCLKLENEWPANEDAE